MSERLHTWAVVAQAPKRLGGRRRIVNVDRLDSRAEAYTVRYNLLSSYPYSRLTVRKLVEAAR